MHTRMLGHLYAQGVHGTGTTSYTPTQYTTVCRLLIACAGVPLTVATIAAVTKLSGNTVRAIARDADGVEFVLSESSKGYKVARTHGEAAKGTNRLRSQVAAMQTRIDRRTAYAAELPT